LAIKAYQFDRMIAINKVLKGNLTMRTLIRRAWCLATGRRHQIAPQRPLGNDLTARQSRDVWLPPWLQDISQDVRFGVRMLAKDRRFTIAATLALGLGIGVNNSVFTIANTALFRPLPFPRADRLVDSKLMDTRGSGQVSYADFLAWWASAKSFEGFGADSSGSVSVSDDRRPSERMRGTFISATAFPLLRVRPILGREFIAGDEKPGVTAVAIFSYETWQGRYGGDPSIIGHSVSVNGVPTTVIGVMPPGFGFPMIAQLWQPVTAVAG